MQEIAIVVLAAGGSSRLGEPKQLLIYEGSTFLERTMRVAMEVVNDKICVVLGANAEIITQQVPQVKAKSIVNENWQEGMGTSIAVGLKTIINIYPGINAVIFMTVDQPFVTSDHIKAIIQLREKSGKPIAASSYLETSGIPALFDQSYFNELLELKTDKGAKDIIRSNGEQVAKIDLPGGEVDIDTPQQYASLQNQAK